MIGEKHNDHIGRLELALDAEYRLHGCSAGVPHEQTLHAGQLAGPVGTAAVSDFDKIIDEVKSDIIGDDVFAQAFHFIWIDLILVEKARLPEPLQNRAIGINAYYLDIRVLFLEIFGRAREGTASAGTADVVRNLTFCIAPNLRACAVVMSTSIIEIVVLPQVERIGGIARDLLRPGIVGTRVFRLYICGADDYFSPHSAQQSELFLPGLARHGQDALVTFHRANNGQAVAGIARSRFHNSSPRLELTRFLSLFHHIEGNAVFS